MQHAARELTAPGEFVSSGSAKPECPRRRAHVDHQGQGQQLGQGQPLAHLPSRPCSMEPLDAVGDDVQEPLTVGHVVRVAGFDRFPGVPARISCRNPQRAGEPGPPVGAVVGQRLAGPLAGDQDAASGVAEVFAAVGFALAGARAQAWPGVLGLDAVAEPVRSGRRAGFVAQRVGEPGGVGGLGVGGHLVAAAERGLWRARRGRVSSPRLRGWARGPILGNYRNARTLKSSAAVAVSPNPVPPKSLEKLLQLMVERWYCAGEFSKCRPESNMLDLSSLKPAGKSDCGSSADSSWTPVSWTAGLAGRDVAATAVPPVASTIPAVTTPAAITRIDMVGIPLARLALARPSRDPPRGC